MKFKILISIFAIFVFSGCSWQSILSFGLIKSDEEIMEQKTLDNLKEGAKICKDEKNSILCNNIAVEYSNIKDFKNAEIFYKISCELGLATACSNLGQIYEHGLIDGSKDTQRALAYYKLGCGSNDGVGCYNRALIEYTTNKYNFKNSVELFKKSCDLEYKQACVVLKKLTK